MNESGLQIAKNAVELKELELNALLEVTQAINNNLPTESLFKIFKFILMSNLQIGKMALYVWEEDWRLATYFGVTEQDLNSIQSFDSFTPKKITYFQSADQGFNAFDMVLPITHKSQVLAHLFLGGVHFHPEEAPENYLNFIQALSNILIVAVENKRLARERLRQEAFKKEMEIAKNVQTHLLPSKLPESDTVEIDAKYIPHRIIGGDFYDCISLPNDLYLFCVADVSGKGVPAAILMSNFQASLRTLVRQNITLMELVKELNIQICRSAKKENFITVFIGVLDIPKKQFRYINAGHNPPILRKHDGSIKLLEEGTTILGMFDDLPFIEEVHTELEGRNSLVLYTDGLSESVNAADEMFGDERIQEIVGESDPCCPVELNKQIMSELNDFIGAIEFSDDITLLSCRFEL